MPMEMQSLKKRGPLKFTIASLLTDGSFAIGAFCFDALPTFTAGDVRRGREESAVSQPPALPSSAAKTQTTNFILPFIGIK